MRLKELFKEDDAVSPVIGVILMVAITVILAAVIASFVLGLGDSTGEVQPTTNFEFDYNGTALEVTSTSGDPVDPSNLYLRGTNTTRDVGATNYNLGSGDSVGDNLGSSGLSSIGDLSDDEINSGEGFTINFGSSVSNVDQYDIDLVWETSEDSTTLATSEGPDA